MLVPLDAKDGVAEFLLENFARRRARMSPAVPMGLACRARERVTPRRDVRAMQAAAIRRAIVSCRVAVLGVAVSWWWWWCWRVSSSQVDWA